MKKPFRLLLLLLCSCLTPWLPAAAEEGPLPDSLLDSGRVYEYTFCDFGLAERIMGELRRLGRGSVLELDNAEGDLYYNTGNCYRAVKFYLRALENPEATADPRQYMKQLHRLISCYDAMHNQAEKAHCVELLLRTAENNGDEAMRSIALFNMGKMLCDEGNREQGYPYMWEAVAAMRRADYNYKYDNLRYEYNTLLIYLIQDRRYEEALQTLDELEQVVTAATGGEAAMGGLDDKERKTLLANRAVVLNRMGRHREADSCYRVFCGIGTWSDPDNNLVFPYMFDRGMHDQVIRVCIPYEEQLRSQGDTVCYRLVSIKKSLALAYRMKGDYRKAASYYEQLAILRDSIKRREQKSAALELAALYASNQKDLQLHQQAADMRIRDALLVFVGFSALMLGLFLWRMQRHNRTIRRKNESMVETIEELLANKQELYRIKREKLGRTGLAPENTEAATCPSKEADGGDRALFERIEQEIIGRRLFLQPDFSREELIRTLNIPRNRFAQLFRRYAGKSFTRYVNDHRLEYAARMLRDVPEYTIDAVAKECGMTTVQTFHRLFPEKFGVTPAEFRAGLKRTD